MKGKILLIFLVSILCGCSTLMSRKYYSIGLNSHPQQATVKVTNRYGQTIYQGPTPIILWLRPCDGFFRPVNYTAEFVKEGYQSQIIPIRTKISEWAILSGPLILFDGFTNRAFRFKQEYFQPNLIPINTNFSIQPDSIK